MIARHGARGSGNRTTSRDDRIPDGAVWPGRKDVTETNSDVPDTDPSVPDTESDVPETEPPRRSLLDRTLAAVSWTVSANGVAVVALGVRAIILARLLPVETFGVYALSRSIVAFADPLLSFGMGGALIHRGEASRDEARAAAVHFTLSLVFALVWALAMAGGALTLTGGELQTALLVMIATSAVGVLAVTPTTLLKRLPGLENLRPAPI